MNSGKWRFVQASAVGLAHRNQGTECQDRAACATVETSRGQVLIAAVADGAGSTARGQIGAEIACRLFVEEVAAVLGSPAATVKSLGADFAVHWIKYFQQKIAEVGRKDACAAREYASTFIGAVAGENSACFFQIGDGAVVYSVSGTPESYRFGVSMPETEYVNMTDFLTDEEAAMRLGYAFIDHGAEDLILFSDGVFPVAVDYQTRRPHEPFLIPMIAPLRRGLPESGLDEKLENFLASSKMDEKSDDDKTIILASRAPAPFPVR